MLYGIASSQFIAAAARRTKKPATKPGVGSHAGEPYPGALAFDSEPAARSHIINNRLSGHEPVGLDTDLSGTYVDQHGDRRLASDVPVRIL